MLGEQCNRANKGLVYMTISLQCNIIILLPAGWMGVVTELSLVS